MNISNQLSEDSCPSNGLLQTNHDKETCGHKLKKVMKHKLTLLFLKSIIFEVVPSLIVLGTAIPILVSYSEIQTADDVVSRRTNQTNINTIVANCTTTVVLEIILFLITFQNKR